MPIALDACTLDAALGHGCTHFVLIPKQATLPNGATSGPVSGSVGAICLLGVPGAIAGPYELRDAVSFSGAALSIQGPDFPPPSPSRYPFIPGGWRITVADKARAGHAANGDTSPAEVSLKLSCWGQLDGELLDRFELAWAKLRDNLKENALAVDEVLQEIKHAKAMKQSGPESAAEAEGTWDDE